jgi:hypothetical protein
LICLFLLIKSTILLIFVCDFPSSLSHFLNRGLLIYLSSIALHPVPYRWLSLYYSILHIYLSVLFHNKLNNRNRDWLRALVNAITTLWVPEKTGNFVTGRTYYFWRWTVLHGVGINSIYIPSRMQGRNVAR